jgi:hypothetical protein
MLPAHNGGVSMETLVLLIVATLAVATWALLRLCDGLRQ